MLRRARIPFRTHVRELPGWPDIVVDQADLVIMVHGCYWHRHSCRNGHSVPRRRRQRWIKVFQRRIERDRKVTRQLRTAGWRVLIVWECHVHSQPSTVERAVLDAARRQFNLPESDLQTDGTIDNLRNTRVHLQRLETEESMSKSNRERGTPG